MTSIGNILNDHERFKRTNRSNDNEVKKLEITEDQVDKVADWLQFELNSGEESRAFYCKTARIFPRGYLVGVVARAQKYGKHPNKLFSYLIKREFEKRGIE